MKPERVTMEKIARKLGISKSVVSVAISNKYGVSEETRTKVLLAAHEMGYDFSRSKYYSAKKNKKITLVIASKQVLSEDFWSDIILGIEAASNDLNVYLQIFIFNYDMQFKTIVNEIHESNTNGLILIKDYDEKLVSKLNTTNLPMVVVDPKHFTNVHCPQICVSNYDSAYFCAKYLIDKGHKHLGFLGDISFSYSFLQRFNGFRDAIIYDLDKDLRLTAFIEKADDQNVICSLDGFKNVYSTGDFPTALLCANDLAAFMVYDTLREFGLNIPDDVSVIGFDNLEKSKWLNMTTVNVPKYGMGRKAVEKLLQIIQKRDRLSEKIELAAELIERSSVKDMVKHDEKSQ